MKEAIDSYSIYCKGADSSLEEEIDTSLTVFDDGTRQIGCPHLTSLHECSVAKEKDTGENDFGVSLLKRCIHLYPVDAIVDEQSM